MHRPATCSCAASPPAGATPSPPASRTGCFPEPAAASARRADLIPIRLAVTCCTLMTTVQMGACTADASNDDAGPSVTATGRDGPLLRHLQRARPGHHVRYGRVHQVPQRLTGSTQTGRFHRDWRIEARRPSGALCRLRRQRRSGCLDEADAAVGHVDVGGEGGGVGVCQHACDTTDAVSGGSGMRRPPPTTARPTPATCGRGHAGPVQARRARLRPWPRSRRPRARPTCGKVLENGATARPVADSCSAPTETMPSAAAGREAAISKSGSICRSLSFPAAATTTVPAVKAAWLRISCISASNIRRFARYASSAAEVASSTGQPGVDEPFDQPREVEAQRHRDHLRALLDRPLDPAEDHVRVAAAVVAEDLPDERLGHPAGYADPGAVHVPAEDRARAVRAVPLPVAVARAGEVLLDELDAGERRVRRVDPGVQHGDDHARPRCATTMSAPTAPTPQVLELAAPPGPSTTPSPTTSSSTGKTNRVGITGATARTSGSRTRSRSSPLLRRATSIRGSLGPSSAPNPADPPNGSLRLTFARSRRTVNVWSTMSSPILVRDGSTLLSPLVGRRPLARLNV